MPLPNLDFLFTSERDLIATDVVGLLADVDLSVPVTYKDFISTVFTPQTGTQTPTYTDLSIRLIRNALPAREVAASNGLYQMGDLQFIIARADLVIIPTREDRIIDGTVTYELVTWDSDPLAQLWRVVARKVT